MLSEALATELEKVPGLVAAYLFGSHARGEARSTSDVDVALLFDSPPTSFDDYPLELAGDLERVLGASVDVVVLNRAPSDLVHRVLQDGILVVERDRGARVRFEVRSRNDYFDMIPIRNACRHPRAGT